ncbi:MAG: hypothetical protein CMD36_05200 [Flavobacteriales bacterium]|nr:hypothetical protein [Flavobacteriales bacterium]
MSILCAFFGFTNGLVVANGMIGAINATKLNQGAASGLMGALQVGFGGINIGKIDIHFRQNNNKKLVAKNSIFVKN